MLTQKNAKAYAVLAIVMDKMGDDFVEVVVEPYLNGRESGFAVYRLSSFGSGKWNKAVFSEERNTDNIVVYTGDLQDFSIQGNTPTEDAWHKSTAFIAYDYVKAADFIIAHLAS
jgi:hypothetical protein